MKISDKKNRIKWVIIALLGIIGVSFFFTPSTVFTLEKEIAMDSLYVDYNGSLTVHIRNFRDTEECIRKVFQYYEEVDYKAVCFVSNKGATHIDHKRMYVDDLKSYRLSFLKCDSIPFSARVFHLGLIKEPRPMTFDITTEGNVSYFKGDFMEMNFTILYLFRKAVLRNRADKGEYHTYVLVNKEGTGKFELNFHNDEMGICRTYKVY